MATSTRTQEMQRNVLQKTKLGLRVTKTVWREIKKMLKLQQRFRNEVHIVFTENVNQTALNMSDERRLQKFDQAISYRSSRGAGTICRAELT